MLGQLMVSDPDFAGVNAPVTPGEPMPTFSKV